jgi:hypothetical protein
MKPRPVAVALLLAFAPAALMFPPVCGVCHAQAAADDATTAMARARFKEGVEYFDKGQFELARAAFLQAYALKKHPAVLLNLAWSCLKSGHPAEGEHYFKQLLSEGGDITDKQRADANDGLNQAHAKLGRIEVAGAPPGTDVSVDGESVGATPLAEPTFVEAGAHTVKMRSPDGSIDSESATVAAGERTVVRFTRAATAGPAVSPAPAPAPPPPATPAAAPPAGVSPANSSEAVPATPVPEATVRATPTAPEPERSSNEMSIAPFIVGGAVVAASAAVAIAMKFSKDSAQNKADTQAQQISTFESQNGISPARCSSSSSMPALPAKAVAACAVWNSNNSVVNEDATVANVAIGVGVAALVATAIYGIVYATHSRSTTQAMILPMVGPSFGGLGLHVRF